MNFKKIELVVMQKTEKVWQWSLFVDRDKYAGGEAPNYMTALESAQPYLFDLNLGAHW